MAYSFIAITPKKPDWQKLNAEVFNPDSAIEMFPITSNESGVFYLGISIPIFKFDENPDTWSDLINIINKLKTEYSFRVFDLYNGFFVDGQNIEQVKKSLTS